MTNWDGDRNHHHTSAGGVHKVLTHAQRERRMRPPPPAPYPKFAGSARAPLPYSDIDPSPEWEEIRGWIFTGPGEVVAHTPKAICVAFADPAHNDEWLPKSQLGGESKRLALTDTFETLQMSLWIATQRGIAPVPLSPPKDS